MKRNVLYVFSLLLAVQYLSSCNGGGKEAEVIEEEILEEIGDVWVFSDSLQAAENYRTNCGGCHGQNLSSFVERDWIYGDTYEEILNSIDAGYPDNGMPAYGEAFTETELNDLTSFIKANIQGKTQETLLADNPDLSGVIESDDMTFQVETLTDEIDGIPWALHQLPSGDILITERGGKLYRLDTNKDLFEISGVPTVVANSQGGLLDVTTHPDFEENQWIYLSYSKRNPTNSSQRTTAVARAVLSRNELQDLQDIFIGLPYTNSSIHFGSRLLFDDDGYLFISIGDRYDRDTYPQSLDNSFGKVHRLNDDGSVPQDNPFVGQLTENTSIYTYGIRNPQGLAIHPETRAIWEGEHGPRGGDEINIIEAGNNYGWPVISYGINYNGTIFTELTEQEGMEQPIHYWVPSIAPCGMDFLSGDYYQPWQNDLFVGSLKFEHLHRLKMVGNRVIGTEELLTGIGRVRDVHMGQDGYLYLAVENPGRVLRLVPFQ